jgi:hypothetical protein
MMVVSRADAYDSALLVLLHKQYDTFYNHYALP